MEEKNELNDILLQSDNDSGSKNNMLLIIAALLIIFFLGVVGYKIVSDTSGSSKLPTKVSTGAKSDNFSKIDVKTNDNLKPEGKDPIEKQKEDDFNKKLEEIRAKYQKEADQAKTEETAKENIPSLPVETKITPEPQKEAAKKPEPKKITPVKTVKSEKTSSKRNNYYVQIGSFTKKPSKDILGNITKKGFNYKLRKAAKDGKKYTRLYVGPYKTKKEAEKAMAKIEKSLKVDGAFVKKDY